MTRDDIQRIMDEVPGLNDHGIGVPELPWNTPEERKDDLVKGKQDLLDRVDQCSKVCEWLQQIDKTKSINDWRSSYSLKDIAEADIPPTYVTNGTFITAAIHCGFPYRVRPGNPHVTFGMSKRSIKAVMERQKLEGKRH